MPFLGESPTATRGVLIRLIFPWGKAMPPPMSKGFSFSRCIRKSRMLLICSALINFNNSRYTSPDEEQDSLNLILSLVIRLTILNPFTCIS